MTTRIKIMRLNHVRVSSFMWIILIIVSFGALPISYLGLSNFIYYFADIFNIFLFLYALNKINILHRIKWFRPLELIGVGFLVITILGILGNDVSILLAAWGIRNIYRYFIFFLSCVLILNRQDIDRFMTALPVLFWINFFLTLLQFFVFGIKGDYLGGIFGINQGCNGSTTIFLNIFIALIIAKYLNRMISLKRTTIYCFAYFLIAALTETKGNFVFFVMIVLLCILFCKKGSRTFTFGIAAAASLCIGLIILNAFFPDAVNILLNFEAANHYMDATYYGTTTFTRNGIFSVANALFFAGKPLLSLFGYGIGGCEMSSYFSSAFYDQYGYMNYRIYSAAMTLLETGYLGFLLFVLFFVLIARACLKMNKKRYQDSRNYIFVAVAILAVFGIVYNFYSNLYTDMGYWLFFVLSFGFVYAREDLLTERYEAAEYNIEAIDDSKQNRFKKMYQA